MTEGVVAGQTYSLKIASNSDGYECTFGNEAPVSGGFDFQLTSIDPDYVYVGMFVARKADVTFSNVSLVINDDPEATSDDTSNDTSDDTSADTSSETSDDASAEPVLEADASVEETSSEKLAEAAPAAETKAENLVRTSAVKTGDLSNLLIYALASTLALRSHNRKQKEKYLTLPHLLIFSPRVQLNLAPFSPKVKPTIPYCGRGENKSDISLKGYK